LTIHLRSINDSRGDVTDYHWFCSRSCYLDDLAEHEPTETYEEGGAYPCGAEHDSPDFCTRCGDPVGNPLTDEGVSLVREWLRDLPFRLDPTGTNTARAEALRATYPDTLTSR
jgi:hypothetical protein